MPLEEAKDNSVVGELERARQTIEKRRFDWPEQRRKIKSVESFNQQR